MKKAIKFIIVIMAMAMVVNSTNAQSVTKTVDKYNQLGGWITATVNEKDGAKYAVVLFRDNDYQTIVQFEGIMLTPENYKQFTADYKAMTETKCGRGERLEWDGDGYTLIKDGLLMLFQENPGGKLIPICGTPKKLVPFLESNLIYF